MSSNEGWICPRCKRVLSPYERGCNCTSSPGEWYPPNTVPNTYPPSDHPFNEPVGACPKCGLQLHRVMGYVCTNYPCPTGLGGTYCGILTE